MDSIRKRPDRPSRSPQPDRALDPAVRLRLHGPIRPMDKPGLLERLFGWR